MANVEGVVNYFVGILKETAHYGMRMCLAWANTRFQGRKHVTGPRKTWALVNCESNLIISSAVCNKIMDPSFLKYMLNSGRVESGRVFQINLEKKVAQLLAMLGRFYIASTTCRRRT